MKLAALLLVAASLLGGDVHASDQAQPWSKALEVIGYAATARASFAKGCSQDNGLSTTPAYRVICPKLGTIPAELIERTALPYLQKHLSAPQALDAIEFYTSPIGRGLPPKILKEIETGKYDQLTAEDLQQMNRANKLPFGQALKQFAMDREVNIAVARAMLTYEPYQARACKTRSASSRDPTPCHRACPTAPADASKDAPSFVSERPGDRMQRHPEALRSTQRYVQNVAQWLAGA